MNIYDEPKIDCHNHIFDPSSFPYAADAYYRPAGQEIGTAAQFRSVLDAYGVRHALVVGPNSGYGQDNRCLLDAIAKSGGRFKGIAVVSNDIDRPELERLRAAWWRRLQRGPSRCGILRGHRGSAGEARLTCSSRSRSSMTSWCRWSRCSNGPASGY